MSGELEKAAVLNISRVEGLDKLGYGNFYCRVVVVPTNDNIPQQKFKTPMSKNGIWDQDFHFVYGDSNDEIVFEVCEQKWFREAVVASGKLCVSELPCRNHVNLCSGKIYFKVFDTNRQPIKNPRRLSGRKRSKREISSDSDFDMAGYFQKKIEVHRNAIESLDSITDIFPQLPQRDSSKFDKEALERHLVDMEASLTNFNGTDSSFKTMLDTLQPSADPVATKEINLWDALNNLQTLSQMQPQVQAQQLAQVQHLAQVANIETEVPRAPQVVVYREIHDDQDTSVELDLPQMDLPQMDGASEIPNMEYVRQLEEKVQAMQNELELEKAHSAILKKRTVELEVELTRKVEEIAVMQRKDVIRDKVVWERLTLVDEKMKKVEKERDVLHDNEKKLIAQEKELEKREQEVQKNAKEIKAQKETFIRSLKSSGDSTVAPKLPALENLWSMPSSNIGERMHFEEKLTSLSNKLAKLDQLEVIMVRLDNFTQGNSNNNCNSGPPSNRRTPAVIKAEMESYSKTILDEKSTVKEREAANMKFEKLYVELTMNEEYKMEVKQALEEKRRINEPLNQEALKSMLQKYANIADEELLVRKQYYAALSLIGMDHHKILGKHQNDFNQFLLGDLTLEELRAIRASLPIFRRDQKRQLEFVESVDLKIEHIVKNPPPVQVSKPKKLPMPKDPSLRLIGHQRSNSCGGGIGNLAGQVMEKMKKRVEA